MARKSEKQKLDPAILKELANFVIERLREEETSRAKERYDSKLANVKMLLRNYRSLSDYAQNAIYDAAQVDEETEFYDILELMGADRRTGLKIESIRESAVRTRLIIDHVDNMLDLYKLHCERSPKDEDRRRYRTVYAMYISPEVRTAEQISEDEFVGRSTVYRDIDDATEQLTAMIFGIDGLYLMKK
jgi:hypothetical protein